MLWSNPGGAADRKAEADALMARCLWLAGRISGEAWAAELAG